jgi:hypothetical protein
MRKCERIQKAHREAIQADVIYKKELPACPKCGRTVLSEDATHRVHKRRVSGKMSSGVQEQMWQAVKCLK